VLRHLRVSRPVDGPSLSCLGGHIRQARCLTSGSRVSRRWIASPQKHGSHRFRQAHAWPCTICEGLAPCFHYGRGEPRGPEAKWRSQNFRLTHYPLRVRLRLIRYAAERDADGDAGQYADVGYLLVAKFQISCVFHQSSDDRGPYIARPFRCRRVLWAMGATVTFANVCSTPEPDQTSRFTTC
jgi:hypothetical protein